MSTLSTCQCGGIIREQGKPFGDILRSCSCANPVAVKTATTYTTTTGTSPIPTKRESEASNE